MIIKINKQNQYQLAYFCGIQLQLKTHEELKLLLLFTKVKPGAFEVVHNGPSDLFMKGNIDLFFFQSLQTFCVLDWV